jgi:AraC-like DNA-binding protein
MSSVASGRCRYEWSFRQIKLTHLVDLENPLRGLSPKHIQLRPGRFIGEITRFGLGHTSVNVADYEAPLRIANGAFSSKSLTLLISSLDSPDNVLNGLSMRRDKLLVFPRACDHEFRLRGKMKWVGIEMCPDELNRLFELLYHRELSSFGNHAKECASDPSILHCVRRLVFGFLRVLRSNPVWCENERNRRTFHETLLDLMVGCLFSSNQGEKVSLMPRRTHSRRIFKTAEDYICSHSNLDISIGDLCSVTNSSKSSLYRAFQDHLGLTPHEFLTKKRLADAQKLLRSSSRSSTSVAATAMDCGFSHLGRFSAYYKRLFGEYPSQTLSRE